ncbi:MAG TPA: hypothetical protein VN675_07110 [Burkholderiales bacterium]|nr:hypothetical protein [Burkholderiales bacterium]
MDAARVYRVLDLIPDRTSRTQLGAAFADVRATTCLHPERLALLAEFLHWLSPIYPTTKDDQMRLGLFAAKQARPEEEDENADLQDETAELEAEEETVV